MDCYSFDSEAIDSLNLLRPPVKRVPWNRNGDISVYCGHNKNNFKVLSHKLSKHSKRSTSFNKRPSHEDSSTSLILKKTSESQILKLYPVVSYTSLHYQSSLQKTDQQSDQQAEHQAENQTEQIGEQETEQQTVKNKPLIQVTVIPKSDQKSGAKLLRKQRIDSKTLQTTSSNHENSIQTKNVYLVVAGRKKEKIYEIKTTGSENFEKESIKDDAVGNLSNFKHFIKNFNMDRKKKKDKKDVKLDKRNEPEANTSVCETKTPTDLRHVCNCSPAEDTVDDARPKRSRVRIFGRLGLTEDDRYVLKCQATVDDKPVPTTMSTAEKQMSSSSLANYSNNKMSYQRVCGMACVRGKYDTHGDIKSLRDSIMQTDSRNDAVNELLIKIDNKNKISNESQSTQVNFNNTISNGNCTSNADGKTSLFRTSEHTRCKCAPSNNGYPGINNGFDTKNLKSCQSPLVIISVFPKQDNNASDFRSAIAENTVIPENTLCDESVMCEDNTVLCEGNTAHEEDISEVIDAKVTIKKSVRSRSPSPKFQNIKAKGTKIIEARNVKTSSKNIGPLRSKISQKDSRNGTDSPKQPLQFFNSNISKETADSKRKISPRKSPRGKSPPVTPNKSDSQNKKASRQSLKPKPKSPKRKVDVGVNTEHLKAKQDLIDSYTYQLTEQMNSSRDKPVETVSKIAVNIESENEFYDVSFRQSKFTTDLNVRKSTKEASAQNCYEDFQKLNSIENYSPNTCKKHRRNSICQSVGENQSDDFNNNASRLTLRDSLEIGHRREVKGIKYTQTRNTGAGGSEELTINSDDMEYLAPLKHFTGDNCTICDPVERDREIRELLGVEGRRAKTQIKDTQSQASAIGDLSRHCFYSNQCDTTFVAGFALGTNTRIARFARRNHNDPKNVQFDYHQRQYENNYNVTNSTQKKSNNTSIRFKHVNQNEVDQKNVATETDAELTYRQDVEDDECPCDGVHKVCSITGCEKSNFGTQYDKNDGTRQSKQKYIDRDSKEQINKKEANRIVDTEQIYRRKTGVSRKYNDPNSDESDNEMQNKVNDKTKRSTRNKYSEDDLNKGSEQTYHKEAQRKSDPDLKVRRNTGVSRKYNAPNSDESDNEMQHKDNDKTKRLSSFKNTEGDPNEYMELTDQKETKRKTDPEQGLRRNTGVSRKFNDPNSDESDNEIQNKDSNKTKHMSRKTNDDSNKHFEKSDQKEIKSNTDAEQNRQNEGVDKRASKNYDDQNSDESDKAIQLKDSVKTKRLSSRKNSTDNDPNNHLDQTNLREVKQNASAGQHQGQNAFGELCPCNAERRCKVTKCLKSSYGTQYEVDDKIEQSNQKHTNNDLIDENKNDDDPNNYLYDNSLTKDNFDQVNHKEVRRKTGTEQKLRQSTDADKGAIRKADDSNSDPSEHKMKSKHSGKTKRLTNHKNTNDDPNEYFEQTNQQEENLKTDVDQKHGQSEGVDKGASGKLNDSNSDQSEQKIQSKHSNKTKKISTKKNSDEAPNKRVEQANQKEAKRKKSSKIKNNQNIDENITCVCSRNGSEQSDKICKGNDKTKCLSNLNIDDAPNKHFEQTNQKDSKRKTDPEQNVNYQYQTDQYERANVDRTSLYQQLTLNRNVQIFLQVEQFAKQKPIVLSKKQYKRIKKTIQHTVLDKDKGKGCIYNCSIVSVKEKDGNDDNDVLVFSNTEAQNNNAFNTKDIKSIKEGKKHTKTKKRSSKKKEKDPVDTVVLFSNETRGSVKDQKLPKAIMKRAASSMEIRNASSAYWQHVTFSSTNMGSIGSSSYARRNQSSIKTIFRGHKKSHTPNLGTSAFSLLSGANVSESQSMKLCSPDSKVRKPFLKRLMSCLVMRSATASGKNGPISNPPSVNSSVDSYHISTSLGAIEMTSSIYDTSASFYSDHSIHPLNSKLKKSFFSSMRGFLTSRKS